MSTLVQCLPGNILVHYHYQRLSSKGESDNIGQLLVTPKMVAKKISDMKGNTSPGVDGIPPKLQGESVEQISVPLQIMFSYSLDEGIVMLEWKEGNIIPLFKKGSRFKSENYRPVSLTSVISKLLERLIKDHLDYFFLLKLTL